MTDLTPIVNAVVALVTALITCFLIPYIKSKYNAEKMAEAEKWVKIAVGAAEQIFFGNDRGAEKKAYVLDFLKSKGFTLDIDSIDKMIESAVLEMNKNK